LPDFTAVETGRGVEKDEEIVHLVKLFGCKFLEILCVKGEYRKGGWGLRMLLRS